MKNWKHSKTTLEGEHYEISGINIWNHTWLNTGNTIPIKDLIYNQDFLFNIYRIEHATKHIEFATGEFSNGVWGIYEREK